MKSGSTLQDKSKSKMNLPIQNGNQFPTKNLLNLTLDVMDMCLVLTIMKKFGGETESHLIKNLVLLGHPWEIRVLLMPLMWLSVQLDKVLQEVLMESSMLEQLFDLVPYKAKAGHRWIMMVALVVIAMLLVV